MAKDEIGNEIEALRAQVATLKSERKTKEKKQAQVATDNSKTAKGEADTQESTATESTKDEAEAEAVASEETDISKMFQELVDTIDGDLKDASPMTVLVVFALGVLVGRLLPR